MAKSKNYLSICLWKKFKTNHDHSIKNMKRPKIGQLKNILLNFF